MVPIRHVVDWNANEVLSSIYTADTVVGSPVYSRIDNNNNLFKLQRAFGIYESLLKRKRSYISLVKI